jgi:hypothetical protein
MSRIRELRKVGLVATGLMIGCTTEESEPPAKPSEILEQVVLEAHARTRPDPASRADEPAPEPSAAGTEPTPAPEPASPGAAEGPAGEEASDNASPEPE